MKAQIINNKGVTLVELLVVLVISAFLIGGIYQLFVSQTKAYAVQDEVVEVQQSIRSAMEILLRDLRMAGFDDDRTPGVTIPTPVVPEDHAVTVRYEHNGTQNEVRYWIDDSARLLRQETRNGVSTTETVLENVEAFNLVYGIDENLDGAMDDRNGNNITDDWISAGAVGARKVVSVRVGLTARPEQVNPDMTNVSPRTLTSSVTFRNLTMGR
jgi:prepilin-type N-terminal cleavage/methylation domain-containing protein